MSEETRIELIAKAMRLQGYNVSMELVCSLLKTLEKIDEVGEGFSIKDAVAIEISVEKKYPKE